MSVPGITLDEEREVAVWYGDLGFSPAAIAKAYGCSRNSIRTSLARQDIALRKRKPHGRLLTDWEEQEIVRLYQEGCSQTELAKQFGCKSLTTLRKALRRQGVTQRYARFGSKAGNWRGGKPFVDCHGYVQVYISIDDSMVSMASAKLRVLEHRLVMARHMGRPLSSGETVHHINGDRTDNRIENLQLHARHHGRYVNARCGKCGLTHVIFGELA